MKKNIILIVCIIAFLNILAQNDSDAKQLLDNVSKTMSSYDNVSINFEYVLNNKTEDVRQELNGDVVLQGDKYVVNLFGSTQMYDGSKTYTIIPENEEINISNVDIDDENTLTPSKFFSFYKSGYTYRMDDLKSINGKQTQFVKLTPIDTDSEVSGILIGVELKNNHINQVVEIGKNGTDTILTVKKMMVNQNITSAMFEVDEKKYEAMGYIINK